MGSGFTTLESNMLDNGKATVIGEYSMSSNERRVSTWFNLINLLNSNLTDLNLNSAYLTKSQRHGIDSLT